MNISIGSVAFDNKPRNDVDTLHINESMCLYENKTARVIGMLFEVCYFHSCTQNIYYLKYQKMGVLPLERSVTSDNFINLQASLITEKCYFRKRTSGRLTSLID